MSNLKNYFSFSATERKGIMILSFVIMSLLAISIFDPKPDTDVSSQDFTLFDNEVKSYYAIQDSVRQSKYRNNEYRSYKSKSKSSYKPNKETAILLKDEEVFVKNFIVEINSASEEEFQKLKGIGKVLSERIVKFRKSLGGFYNITQLTDVYGVKQEVIDANREHLSIKNSSILKVSINQSEFKQLLKHPYLNYDAVKCIFGFRNKSDSVTAQQAISCVTDSLKPKLINYLKQ